MGKGWDGNLTKQESPSRSQGSDAAAMVLARHASSAMSDLYTHMDIDNMRKELEAI
jgi:hypothetical protein